MRSVIVLPTYNEGENIEPFLRAVRKAAPTTDVLVVDDNSPDGTGRSRRRSAPNSAGSRCCTVPPSTVSAAPTAPGSRRCWLGGTGYDVVISMDADFSPRPEQLSRVHPAGRRGRRRGDRLALRHRRRHHRLAGPPPAAVEVGQRLHPGDPRVSTPATARAAIGPTGRPRWPRSIPPRPSAEGYAFLTELVRRLTRDGATVVETPIIFRDRTRGKSKMSGRIIVESMLLVTAWGLLDRWRRLSGRFRR